MVLLITFCTIPVQQMIGLDVMHGPLLTSTAALTYVGNGQVDWHISGSLLLGSLPGVWLGAIFTDRINVRLIRIGLIILILLAGLELLAGDAWH